MVRRDAKPSIGMGPAQTGLEAGPVEVHVTDLLAAIREEFGRQAEEPPSDEELRVLVRLVAAHLRTSNDVWPLADELTEEQAIESFVAASLSRWEPDDDDYGEVPDLVRNGFAQRGLARPSAVVLDALARVALGFLRRRSAPQPPIARVAATDWVVALYRALGDD